MSEVAAVGIPASGEQADERTARVDRTGVTRFLAFSLCEERFAIPLLKVKEVIGLTEITPVPYSPPHFRGIMNLRGQIVSVIDLRLNFKMSKAEVKQETAIVILDLSPVSVGVIVDSVDSVLALSPAEVSPPPDVESNIRADYIAGVARKDDRLILLLDVDRTLRIEELKAMRKTAQLRGIAA